MSALNMVLTRQSTNINFIFDTLHYKNYSLASTKEKI